ncbi:uncharacterized protein [Rutidosis leptorrhynchoides]|uniref:uncharacterized protein n=1 Tax=Rutidosis leptorrhynchoides TaxID=125765 RepID=UPI003A99DA2C
MALATQNHTVQANERTYSYLHELQVGKEAEVRIMICRTWDTHTKYGKYLSTDFIASDEQLTARNTVAHFFISRLKEGSVYLLNKFEVIPKKGDYRLLRDNKVVIQLQGSTFLKKISSDEHEGFIHHPYTSVTPQRGGSTTLEFELVNERRRRVRVTLWGKLGDSFLARKPAAPAQYSIILSSISVRRDYYGGTSLLSTSATLVIDDTQIPTLDDFIKKISLLTNHASLHCSDMKFADDMGKLALQRQLPVPKEGSIADLLALAHRGKNNVADVFKCTVELTNVRMKNGWHYNSCSICKARKSITRQNGGFWCESCDKKATCTTILPNPLANLLNTTQVLLLKINSYYEHGTYESFNCIKVYSDEKDSAPLLSENLDPGTFSPAAKVGAASTIPSATTPKGVKRSIEIPTSVKELEWRSHRKFIVTTSDSEDDTPAVVVNEMDKAGLSNA